MKLPKVLKTSVATRTTVLVLLLIAVVMTTAGIWQMQHVRTIVAKETQRQANRAMDDAIQTIDSRISNVETAVNTAASYADMFAIHETLCNKLMERLILANRDIAAVTLLYAPNYFETEGRYFAPTIYRDPITDHLKFEEIGGPEHDFDYLETDSNWIYTNKLDSAYWCLPYMDSISTKRAMVTYSVPLHDETGAIYAVLCADVDINWIAELVEETKPFSDSEVIVMSRDSQYVYHPDKQWILSINAITQAQEVNNTDYLKLAHRMLNGERGIDTIDKVLFLSDKKQTHDDSPTIVYYAPVKRVQWSVSFTFKESMIMAGPNQLRANMFMLLMVLQIIIAIVLYLVIRAQLWPMKRLAESTRAIAKGDFDVSLPQIKTHDEIRNLRDSFEEMQRSLSHYVDELKISIASKASIESELKVASNIQMAMLPKVFPPYPERDDIDIYGSLTPAKEVGGDLYDFFIRDEKLFFCIGDVSGKGVPAALVMAVTKALFRTISTHESTPSKIMTDINNIMASQNDSNMFVTLFVGVLDLPTGRLRYSNAGHDAPLLIGKVPQQKTDHNELSLLHVDANLPVGVMPDWKFSNQECTIAPDTIIFLYTDGLTEAEDARHAQFGEKRILTHANALNATGSLTPQPLIEGMLSAVHEFVDEAEQSDDLTMLAIKFSKQKLMSNYKQSLLLTNDIQEIPQLNVFVDEACEAVGFDMATTMQMNLAIEEAVVNVMNYAYPPTQKGEIHIDAEANNKRLKFTITDSGTPFDPTSKEEVDTTLSAEERPIGGLGIHLVRQLMSSINYERTNGKNVLTLRKYLS